MVQKVVFFALIVAMMFYSALAASRVRTHLQHTKIPTSMYWSLNGGPERPWRIYDLQGKMSTWLSDTGAYNTGGAFGCGLEKLNINYGAGVFIASVDYDKTMIDYFVNDPKSITDNISAVQQVFIDCLVQYQKKENFVESSKFDFKVSSAETKVEDVEPSCLNNQPRVGCAISPFQRSCDGKTQCGDGIIKCKDGTCNSASRAVATVVLIASVIIAIIFM